MIIHVITSMGSDEAYGGPVANTVGQCRALGRAGHEVCVIAARGAHDAGPRVREVVEIRRGITCRLFRSRRIPGLRFSGVLSMPLIAWLRRTVSRADVVHIHAGRDLVGLSAAWAARSRGARVVWQTHGMIIPGSTAKRIVDVLLVLPTLRWPVARVLALSEVERDRLARVGVPLSRITIVPNGVDPPPQEWSPRPGPPVVLFAARLHPRKRVGWFLQIRERVLASGVNARFLVAGADDGDADAVRLAASTVNDGSLQYLGALTHGDLMVRMAESSVMCLPSADEPFPLSVLEAMAIGLPVVVNESCHIAQTLREAGAAVVTVESVSAMADGVERVLRDPGLAHRLSEAGRRLTRGEMSADAISARLSQEYWPALTP